MPQRLITKLVAVFAFTALAWAFAVPSPAGAQLGTTAQTFPVKQAVRKGMPDPQRLKMLQSQYADQCAPRFPRLASGGSCSSACSNGGSDCASACATCQRMLGRIEALKAKISGSNR